MNAPALIRQLALLEASEAKIAALAARYGLDPERVREIATADPTRGGATEWLVKHAKAGRLRFPEDAEKMREQLVAFSTLRAKSTYTGEKDINRLDPGQLYQLVTQHAGTTGKKEGERLAAQRGVREAGRANGFVVWEVTTPQAGAKLFRGTNWCVKDPKYFEAYGPPFHLVTDEAGDPWALYHQETGDFKDTADDDIEHGARMQLGPALGAAGLLRETLEEAEDEGNDDNQTTLTAYSLAQFAPEEIANTGAAFWYAVHVAHEPWPPELWELARTQVHRDNVNNALAYAQQNLEERWPELEGALVSSASMFDMNEYAGQFLDGQPWPELTWSLDRGLETVRDKDTWSYPGQGPTKGDYARWWDQCAALRPYFSDRVRAAIGRPLPDKP